jgi:hypothetical protein
MTIHHQYESPIICSLTHHLRNQHGNELCEILAFFIEIFLQRCDVLDHLLDNFIRAVSATLNAGLEPADQGRMLSLPFGSIWITVIDSSTDPVIMKLLSILSLFQYHHHPSEGS